MLENELKQSQNTLYKVSYIQCYVSNGLNTKIYFLYLNSEKKIQEGECLTYERL